VAVLRILSGRSDLDEVRQLVMGASPLARAKVYLPDSLITSYAVGALAEQSVIRAVGPDWEVILSGEAPSTYCDGDPVGALNMLKAATVYLTCAFLIPVVRQQVGKSENTQVATLARDVTWDTQRKEFLTQFQVAIGGLLTEGGLDTVAALSRAHPTFVDLDKVGDFDSASDPAAQAAVGWTSGSPPFLVSG
jgi:hypothetical protein